MDTKLPPGGCCGQKYCCQSWSTYVSRMAMLTGGSGINGHPLKTLKEKLSVKNTFSTISLNLSYDSLYYNWFYLNCNTARITNKVFAQQDTHCKTKLISFLKPLQRLHAPFNWSFTSNSNLEYVRFSIRTSLGVLMRLLTTSISCEVLQSHILPYESPLRLLRFPSCFSSLLIYRLGAGTTKYQNKNRTPTFLSLFKEEIVFAWRKLRRDLLQVNCKTETFFHMPCGK